MQNMRFMLVRETRRGVVLIPSWEAKGGFTEMISRNASVYKRFFPRHKRGKWREESDDKVKDGRGKPP